MSNMPSIGKITDTIEQVKRNTYYIETKEDGTVVTDETLTLPVIRFYGTVKTHGTFAGISYDPVKDEITPLSKGSKLSIQKDNAGFAQFVENRKEQFKKFLSELPAEEGTEFELCGEFVGKGIQKGVAVSELPKMYLLFGLRYKLPNEDWEWAQVPNTVLGTIAKSIDDVYSIFNFKRYNIFIDFNNPKEANDQIEKWVQEIDEKCPVGEHFGVENHGEGIVWVGYHKGERYSFKSKGESHSKTVKRNKQKREKDPQEEQKLEFAERVTPDWRLDQMYNETIDTINGGRGDIKKMGDFIKAVLNDIIKEEQQEFKNSGFIVKDIQKFVSNISRDYFKARLNEEAGL